MDQNKCKPWPWVIGAIESGRAAIDAADGQEVTGWIEPEDAEIIVVAPEMLDALKEVFSIGYELVSDVYGDDLARKIESLVKIGGDQ